MFYVWSDMSPLGSSSSHDGETVKDNSFLFDLQLHQQVCERLVCGHANKGWRGSFNLRTLGSTFLLKLN